MSNAREMLARAVVQPNDNFAESAQALTAAFLAGRKTPQEVQLEAAKNALAQQSLLEASQKNQDYVMRQQALDRVSGTYDPKNAALYTADAETGTTRNIHDVFSSPEGAATLRDNAIALLKAGVKPQEINDINRTLGSYQSNVPGTGMTDDMLRRIAGSPDMGPGTSMSEAGQTKLANEDAARDVWKINAINQGKKDLGLGSAGSFGARLPVGYQWVDPNDHAQGMVAIAGGPAAKKNAAEAAKQSALVSAVHNIEIYKTLMVDPNTGRIDKGKLAEANLNIPGMGNGVPFTVGRQATNALETGLYAKFRLDTGAAANETEGPKLTKLFTPSLLDDDATHAQKIANIEAIMSGALTFADPGNSSVLVDANTGTILDISGGPTKSIATGTTSTKIVPAPNVNPAATKGADYKFPAERAAALLPPDPTGAGGIPHGIDPSDWQYMTPQEKALWQQ